MSGNVGAIETIVMKRRRWDGNPGRCPRLEDKRQRPVPGTSASARTQHGPLSGGSAKAWAGGAARRYGAAVTQDVDRQRLLKWAEELEREATGLEDKDRADAGGKRRANRQSGISPLAKLGFDATATPVVAFTGHTLNGA